MLNLFSVLLILNLCSFIPAFANNGKPLTGSVSDPLVEAQEKLMNAKGNYKTVRQQENAIEDMRKATKLSLKAAKLRANAEKLQSRADLLVNKATNVAVSRGLYITNPMAPVMMQPPPTAQVKTASVTSVVPIPGQPINIIVPKQEEVSYDQGSDFGILPEPSTSNDF